ncbi:MAG: serine hydrolase [Flavobacteriaceae bacterium]|nr:serine hydrolase [Flavobacteriaceae bacterium]
MKQYFLLIFSAIFFLGNPLVKGQITYFPDANTQWKSLSEKQVNLNEGLLKKAVSFAIENEYSGERDLRVAILKGFSHEPYHQILGPTKKRAGPAGMIIKNGYIVAQWGDTKRVDMTFSVTKSYLSTVAGLAVDRGFFRASDKVAPNVWDNTFDGDHNQQIQWDHLLNQSSDWSGNLWGGYDWADRPPKEGGIDDWKYRKLYAPGTHFKYNDVRVNVLAYSLLNVWRKPLPQVLKEYIMDPIGASNTWRWYGYNNSWVNIDGSKMQSVSGGGHSGGGLFISTEDHARFGLLFLNKGKWKTHQLISPEWIKKATTPSVANPSYGYLWWLNHKDSSRYVAAAGEDMYYAAGFGGNFIIIIPKENMVVVTRWLEPKAMPSFLEKVMDATK